MTVSGNVKGTDGRTIQAFNVQVTNTSDEIILSQDFKNSIYTLDAIAGYYYWFSAPPIYGGVLVDGADLQRSSSVTIPKSFGAVPDTMKNIYYVAGLGLITLTLYYELKKKKQRRRR